MQEKEQGTMQESIKQKQKRTSQETQARNKGIVRAREVARKYVTKYEKSGSELGKIICKKSSKELGR